MIDFYTLFVILKNNSVAKEFLHSNQIWSDLRRFFEITKVIETYR